MKRRTLLKLPALLCAPLAQAPRLEIGELDPDARYTVVVTPSDAAQADDWRWRQGVSEEIRDCFESAGFERGDVGVLVLNGFDVKVTEVG